MPTLSPVPAPAGAIRSRVRVLPASSQDFVPLEATRISADGTFSGYASLFNVPDLANDIIRPGAFAAALSKRGTRGIRMLYQHRAGEPIGVWTSLKEDVRGLYAEGQLTLGSSKARDILALLKSGALDGLSIGFKAGRAQRAAKSAPRILTEVDLWEISIVTFPMLPGARVTSVKTREHFPSEVGPGSAKKMRPSKDLERLSELFGSDGAPATRSHGSRLASPTLRLAALTHVIRTNT